MKEIKWLALIAVALIAVGFWLRGVILPNKPIVNSTTVEIPGPVEIKNKYIPVESKVDLSPLYDEIAQLKQEKDGLISFIVELAKEDTTIHPPVIVTRPLPQPKYSIAGFGLWPGVMASLNYKDKLTPSGYLSLQYFYFHRFTLGCQVNPREAGLNIGWHLPKFRNLQVKVLVNKEFMGKSWPDNIGVGLGLNL